ncbi:MAG: hypothetical protein IJS69_06070, partial [Selenomonadaceae bacterium]|nr:hypothetical protein [Selenomonadaceae bacterium]
FFAGPKKKLQKERAFVPQRNIHVPVAGGRRPWRPGFSYTKTFSTQPKLAHVTNYKKLFSLEQFQDLFSAKCDNSTR